MVNVSIIYTQILENGGNMKKSRIILTIGLLIILTVIFFQVSGLAHKKQNENVEIWSSSKLDSAIKSSQIEKVDVQLESDVYRIYGITKSGTEFSSEVPKDPRIINDMSSTDVEVNMHQVPLEPWWVKYSILFVVFTLIVKVAPTIVLILILLYLKKIHDAIKANMNND